jgi:hypothetical protein
VKIGALKDDINVGDEAKKRGAVFLVERVKKEDAK